MDEIKILIVDDEEMICDSLCLKISRLKHPVTYTTVTCNSGAKALRLLKNHVFDVIITDMRMPFMSGTTFVKSARADGYKGTVFVLSGYDDYSYVREAFLGGADDYLLKPISVNDLDSHFKKIVLPKSMQQSKTGTAEKSDRRKDIIAYAEDYIHCNYTNSALSMEEVAQYVSLSYSHFSSLFRKKTGTTFPSYLRKLRIEKAIELLNDPGLRIADISYQVGFKYPQQFSNDFKKVTGVYPSEYSAGIRNGFPKLDGECHALP